MDPETHAGIRTAAAAIAAVALVVAAWSAHRIAEAEEEQACWAWISATTARPLAMAATSGALLTLDAHIYSDEHRQQRWEERTTAYDNLFDACKAL